MCNLAQHAKSTSSADMIAASSTDASQQVPPRAAVFAAHVRLSSNPADKPVHACPQHQGRPMSIEAPQTVSLTFVAA